MRQNVNERIEGFINLYYDLQIIVILVFSVSGRKQKRWDLVINLFEKYNEWKEMW